MKLKKAYRYEREKILRINEGTGTLSDCNYIKCNFNSLHQRVGWLFYKLYFEKRRMTVDIDSNILPRCGVRIIECRRLSPIEGACGSSCF